jgi:hypothetical protein
MEECIACIADDIFDKLFMLVHTHEHEPKQKLKHIKRTTTRHRESTRVTKKLPYLR